MKLKPFSTAVTLAITSALLLTACGGNSEDVAGSGGDQTTVDIVAAVDLSALDTGDYPTEPRTDVFETTAENFGRIEAQRLAEFTVLPFEIDPALKETAFTRVQALVGGRNGGVAYLFHEKPENIPVELEDIVYGYSTNARTSAVASDPRVEATLTSLRFRDGASAKAAAEALNEFWTGPQAYRPQTPGKIDILPNTFAASWRDTATSSMQTATAHNDFVVVSNVSAPPEKSEWVTTTTAGLIAEQLKWLDKFPGADIDDPSTWAKMDENNVLRYSLTREQQDKTIFDGVYGPRGYPHVASDPEGIFNLLTENGASHNAFAGSNVFRAKDDAGARRIYDGLLSRLRVNDEMTEESVPKGLNETDTLCLAHPLKDLTVCYTLVGRYVGETISQDVAGAQQQISAQYVILQQADQGAS